jgi:hypothetical protein
MTDLMQIADVSKEPGLNLSFLRPQQTETDPISKPTHDLGLSLSTTLKTFEDLQN